MIKVKRSITNEAGNKFELVVTCNFVNLSDEQTKEYAFDAIWIKEQSKLRAASNSAFEGLNGQYEFSASPKGVRAVAILTVDKVVEMAKAKMTKEQRLEMIKRLEAMD